jgi:hypothetical protein
MNCVLRNNNLLLNFDKIEMWHNNNLLGIKGKIQMWLDYNLLVNIG